LIGGKDVQHLFSCVLIVTVAAASYGNLEIKYSKLDKQLEERGRKRLENDPIIVRLYFVLFFSYWTPLSTNVCLSCFVHFKLAMPQPFEDALLDSKVIFASVL
jgi:hypothetical protein